MAQQRLRRLAEHLRCGSAPGARDNIGHRRDDRPAAARCSSSSNSGSVAGLLVACPVAAAERPDPTAAPVAGLAVAIDYKSVEAYLALPATESLLRDYPGLQAVRFLPYPVSQRPSGLSGGEFGLLREEDGTPDSAGLDFHYVQKNPTNLATAKIYAGLFGLPLQGPTRLLDSSLLLKALVWLQLQAAPVELLLRYNRLAFAAVWDSPKSGSAGAIEDLELVEGLLRRAALTGSDAAAPSMDGFRAWLLGSQAEETFSSAVDWLTQNGCFAAPSYLLQPRAPTRGALLPEDRMEGIGGIENLYVLRFAVPMLRRRLQVAGFAAGPHVEARQSFLVGVPDPPVVVQQPQAAAAAAGAAAPGTPKKTIDVYVDLKSPYAYLALEPTRALERDFHVKINWLPFTLEIPSYVGSAEVDPKTGKAVEGKVNRTPEQWAAVRYSYMDTRRHSMVHEPPIVARGTVKIWDTSMVNIAFLWAKRQGEAVFDRFERVLWPPFWRRELDVEDMAVLLRLLQEAGAQTEGFAAWANKEGREEHDRIRRYAWEELGVFGVPTYVLDKKEVLWGREHLDLVRRHLFEQGFAKPHLLSPGITDIAWTGLRD